jgi:hypothetical protein
MVDSKPAESLTIKVGVSDDSLVLRACAVLARPRFLSRTADMEGEEKEDDDDEEAAEDVACVVAP